MVVGYIMSSRSLLENFLQGSVKDFRRLKFAYACAGAAVEVFMIKDFIYL